MPPLAAELISRPDTLGRVFPHVSINGVQCAEHNANGDHEFAATDEQFDLITGYFVAPTLDEGFNVVIHQQ
jgi:hypothetical protein